MANLISDTTISPFRVITDAHVCLKSGVKIGLQIDREVRPGLLLIGLRFERESYGNVNSEYLPGIHLDHCLQLNGRDCSIDEIALAVEKLGMYYNGDVVGPTKDDRVVDFTVTVFKQLLHGWFRLGDIKDFVEFND